MNRSRSALFVLAALTCLCTQSAAFVFTTERQIEKQSAQTFEQMKQQLPITQNRFAQAYVECVARQIIETLDEPYRSKDWEVVVFDNNAVNAFAMPGGKIGVFTGIFKVARSQHDLAAVIGHEVAHVTSKHASKRANTKGLTGGALAIVSAVIGAPVITQTAMSMGAELGLNRPYGRRQETDADKIGLGYMARAGFDPRESITLWKRMSRAKKGGPSEFLSTHPSDETRIDALIGGLTPALIQFNAAQAEGKNPNCD